ncbi:EamA family transporter RarD [Anaerotignum sp.]
MGDKNYKNGLIYALSCAVIWGFLPIYWNALNPISSLVVIFYRVTLMTLTCLAIQFYRVRNIKKMFVPMFANKKKLRTYIIAGILITMNWSIYIWAVQAGYVIQSSMGYFLEPLLVCLFGMIIYKEKANKWKKISLGFALVGLLVMIIGYREMPIIAIGLATTFATYTAMKKSVDLPPFQSLLYETIFIAPITLLIVFWMEGSGIGAMATGGSGKFILLLFVGIATAVPMGLFSAAARNLPLLTLGLTSYISPSIALVLGIFLFKEPFDIIQFSAFAIIWVGLIFFTYGELADIRNKGKE